MKEEILKINDLLNKIESLITKITVTIQNEEKNNGKKWNC